MNTQYNARLIFPLVTLGLAIVYLTSPLTAQSATTIDTSYTNSKYKYAVTYVPKGWSYYESEYKTLKGSMEHKLLITQPGDLISRPTKAFLLYAGSPEAVFGLHSKVIQKVSREHLIDFYIDQTYNSSIDYVVTKAYTTGEGDAKTYTVEATYLLAGPYTVITTSRFRFKNDLVYHWSTHYFTTHSEYAKTLEAIAGSFQIK